jgi:hypothetical protein
MYKENLEEIASLEYDPLLCTKLKANKEIFNYRYRYVFYADCKSSTDGTHEVYNICFVRAYGKCRVQIFGRNCFADFLRRMPDKCLVYFHNLSYDINFIINKLDNVYRPIIKQGRTLSIGGMFQGKKIVFKDSYSIITSRLKEFPRMFKLESGEKEVFPYQYYSSELLKNGNKVGVVEEALKYIKADDKSQFIENFKKIKNCALSRTDDGKFRLDIFELLL